MAAGGSREEEGNGRKKDGNGQKKDGDTRKGADAERMCSFVSRLGERCAGMRKLARGGPSHDLYF